MPLKAVTFVKVAADVAAADQLATTVAIAKPKSRLRMFVPRQKPRIYKSTKLTRPEIRSTKSETNQKSESPKPRIRRSKWF